MGEHTYFTLEKETEKVIRENLNLLSDERENFYFTLSRQETEKVMNDQDLLFYSQMKS
jgi:hypothetical protein